MSRGIKIAKRHGLWVWCCTLCQPAAFGATVSFDKTVRNTRRHCEHRDCHHRWVARHA